MLKRLISVPIFFTLLLAFASVNRSEAQCTNANVNWDYLDYLERNSAGYSTYITAGMFANMVQTQRFTIGTNRVTVGTNFLTAAILGENTTHTGEAGSFGIGADVSYNANGTITLTFDTAVSNVQFSLYDIDNAQVATITAFEGATPRAPVLTKPAGGNLVIVGNVATAPAVAQANTSNVATLNVAVAGPVTIVTIVISGTAGNFWLSDIQACIYRNFPTNYYQVSEPFTGQPAYILAVHDLNTIYMVDPATGRAVSLYTDNTPRVREINNVAYDPYNKIVYYSIDGLERCTPAGNPDSVKYLRKYDFNTETMAEIIANVNNAPFNIPTFSQGLETGGAAFYNGSLFLGAEGKNSSSNSGREAMIWRIDFDASGNPLQASQAFGTPGDNGGGTSIHDWGDITIKDGILYDYNAQGGAALGNYNIFNMQTCAVTNTYPGLFTANKPRQVAQQWNGNLVWLHDSITTYNGTNVLGSPKMRIIASSGSVPWVAGAGDATEAFRPKADFGDAPSTYDPVALSPALHEKDTALFLGQVFTNDWDWEWSKQTSTDATGDGNDDNDGLTYVSVFDKSFGQYLVQARVYNNTGSNATIVAWFDYNGDGDYDASEAITPITVSSSPVVQNVFLYWSGISSPIANGNYTFLRIRLTSASNSMGTANPTGYFNNGEVEDYRVLVDNFPLAVNMLSFDVKAVNNTTARLNWRTVNEEELAGFGIERSQDGINWSSIGFVNAKGNSQTGTNEYVFNDLQALKGQSFYRLKLTDLNPGLLRYSEIRNIQINDVLYQVSIMPNPAKNSTTLYLSSSTNTDAIVVIHDMQGRKLRTGKYDLKAGENSLVLNNLDQLPDGMYIVRIIAGQQIINNKLVIGKSIY